MCVAVAGKLCDLMMYFQMSTNWGLFFHKALTRYFKGRLDQLRGVVVGKLCDLMTNDVFPDGSVQTGASFSQGTDTILHGHTGTLVCVTKLAC